MLLLVTLALVLASAVLLILGFVQDALGFIYLSMMCAGVAALALFVFARLARRRGAALAGAGIAGGIPGGYVAGAADDSSPAEEPRARRAGTARALKPAEPTWEASEAAWDAEDEEAFRPEPEEIDADEGRPVVVGARPPAAEEEAGIDPWADERAEDWGDEVVFPIEDYDDLRVAEIVPLLSQLDPDELQEVRDRELAGKARATILDRIDDRLGREAVGADPAVTTAAIPAVEPVATGEPAAPLSPAFSDESDAPAKRPAARRSAGSRAAKATAAAAAAEAAAGATAPARKAPARKAPAKKAAPARKAAANEAAPAKKAAPARKTAPAKKTAARKAAPGVETPAAQAPVADPPTAEVQAEVAPEPVTAPPEPAVQPDSSAIAEQPAVSLSDELPGSAGVAEPAAAPPAEGAAKKAAGGGARKAGSSKKAAGPAKRAAKKPE